MSGSLPNLFAGESGPLATNINKEKCHGLAGSWICMSFISQLRSAPSRKNASSRDRGSPHCRRSGECTLNKHFISSILCTKCDFLTMAPNKPNHIPRYFLTCSSLEAGSAPHCLSRNSAALGLDLMHAHDSGVTPSASFSSAEAPLEGKRS